MLAGMTHANGGLRHAGQLPHQIVMQYETDADVRAGLLDVQEDLAAAEAELAGWYETMQRETNALKRIYQFEGHDLLHSSSGAGLGAEGQSPAREGLNSSQATGLVRKMSHNGENVNKTAARQLPQVYFVLLPALPPTVLSIVCAVQDCRGELYSLLPNTARLPDCSTTRS